MARTTPTTHITWSDRDDELIKFVMDYYNLPNRSTAVRFLIQQEVRRLTDKGIHPAIQIVQDECSAIKHSTKE